MVKERLDEDGAHTRGLEWLSSVKFWMQTLCLVCKDPSSLGTSCPCSICPCFCQEAEL